jgi:hypothetical protein
MVEQELANELSQRAAEALTHLVRIMDDQTAKARDRLKAAQMLKTYCLGLNACSNPGRQPRRFGKRSEMPCANIGDRKG